MSHQGDVALAGKAVSVTQIGPKAALGLPRASRRREKMFGLGRPRALDRNAKVRIMHWARCLSRWTEKGRAYGIVTAFVGGALVGPSQRQERLCFPSYETKSASFLMTSFASNASRLRSSQAQVA